ncbi:MAG: TonB-dependent receptor [Pseudomonadota bacterium]
MSNYTPCAPVVRASVAAIIGAAALIGFSSRAVAAAAEEDVEELEEVQVTGTRIQVPGTYTAANPVTTVTGEDLRRLGMINLADALTTLVPQNLSTYQPTMVGDEMSGRGSFFIGNTIANLRGLDPMFGSRTLTLIDGRRVVSTSNQADVVDMNIIPSNLLQRMDVATGGASATYGSGAMAGVVNLVLNNRLQGVNVDLDYGVNEEGDGGNKHIAVSGGTALFDGRGHALFGVEWQKQEAIRDCAAARDWCAKSRTLFTNNTGFGTAPDSPFPATPGFEGMPARFRMSNVRFNQFQPNGAIYSTNVNNTTGFRFTGPGDGEVGIEEYAFGYRGGGGGAFGPGQSMNGDGPLVTTGTTMTPGNNRRTLFTNFEFDFTETTTGYIQANYAKTKAFNYNTYTQGDACVRFDQPGQAAIPGASFAAGQTITYNFAAPDPIWATPEFQQFLGLPPANPFVANYYPGTLDNPPQLSANVASVQWGDWGAFGESFAGNVYVVSVTLAAPYQAEGTPRQLPQLGRDAYAFLYNLTPEALEMVQEAFNNNPSSGPGPDYLVGSNPCAGFTSIYKVWNPQINQGTRQQSETMRAVVGLRGRFGSDWRWDAYLQYGETESSSLQNNVWTNIRRYFALDAVIDDRPDSPTFGQPVCRVVRDGVPTTDLDGFPLSDPDGLARLAEGCKPLNMFGSTFASEEAAQLQRDALNYAFQMNGSSGKNSLTTLAFNTSGTIWQGWAGPLTGAFGLELREDKVDNAGSQGDLYERADFLFGWADAFGGKTRVAEGYSELNLPLVSGLEGLNMWSINAAVRYARYRNKGGAGTTGQAVTQKTTNWKFSTMFEPFDFIRFRMTRSRDLRAAGYRDLFINQPSVPDSQSGVNPWRPWEADTDVQRRERWGTITAGNPALKPEKSDTLTIGVVLQPGGWAQGMRISADYYSIRVKDGIFAPFGGASPITACWEGSGNQDPVLIPVLVDHDDDPSTPPIEMQLPDPDVPPVNGLFDESLAACQDIQFAMNEDGTRDLTNIVSYYTGRSINNDPFQRRGIDFSWDYIFPLNRIADRLPGSLSVTVRGTKALESSGISRDFFGNTSYVDTVGQIRTTTFIPGLPATPRWTGNIITSYLAGDLTLSLSARYIGGAKLDKQWGDSPDDANYMNEEGQYLAGSIDDNKVEPYFNFALNGSYNLRVGNMRQFQVFGSINNLFDKDPPFSGGYVSGASPQFHDIMGRSYRMGVRLRF